MYKSARRMAGKSAAFAMSSADNEKKLWVEAESLRKVAFFGICIR